LYFRVIQSLDELLGEDGILRLPNHLPDTFVMDESRKAILESVVEWVRDGHNVLIEGGPGTGKTALMFMILKELSNLYSIGYVLEGATQIGSEHMDRGIILFIDDLPQVRMDLIRSIIRYNIRGIIATTRSEELAILERTLGVNIRKFFKVVKLEPMPDDKIEEILRRYLVAEAIRVVDKEAISEVVRKAQGLPVYVWQVIRELKISKEDLTLEFARRIPSGMLDYVDDILWRILGGKEERYEALITLLTMTDFVRYAVHQDLYTYIYLAAKEQRLKRRLTMDDILLDTTFDDITRFLAKEKLTYSFRLPHDSWADVLKGRSSGPMSPEISKINARFTKSRRHELTMEAARRAWNESLSKSEDVLRIESFKNNIRVSLGEEALSEIIKVEEKKFIEEKPIEVKPAEVKEKPLKIEILPAPEAQSTLGSICSIVSGVFLLILYAFMLLLSVDILLVSAYAPAIILIMTTLALFLIGLAISIMRYGSKLGKTGSGIISGILLFIWGLSIFMSISLVFPYTDLAFTLVLSTRVIPIFICLLVGISLLVMFRGSENKMGRNAAIVILIGSIIPVLPILDIGLILLGMALGRGQK